MQPSGEVGRFEVDDQPSPPADRKRYSIETHAPQCNNVNHWQFSTSTLLMLTLGTAVALAVSRLDTVFFLLSHSRLSSGRLDRSVLSYRFRRS